MTLILQEYRGAIIATLAVIATIGIVVFAKDSICEAAQSLVCSIRSH